VAVGFAGHLPRLAPHAAASRTARALDVPSRLEVGVPLGIPSPTPPSPPPGPPYVAPPPGGYLTPPMAWNGYNRYHTAVTAAIAEAQARALVTTGMKAAGYDYVDLDGGWDLPRRSAEGTLQPDPAKFPQGIAPLATYVHGLGLKFGIYTSAGTMNCAGTSAGSYGFYRQDAALFADWGVDYIKFDWCHVPFLVYPHQPRWRVGMALASQMAAAVKATGRPMVLDVNDAASDGDWTWARPYARIWRIAPDVRPTYWSIVRNFVDDVDLYRSAGGGGWNDPDMLEIGNGGLTVTEWRTQFSLWSELSAPLIAGNDLTTMPAAARAILLNRRVIAVDQDPLGLQGGPVSEHNGLWVLSKRLADGGRSVVLFNESPWAANISTTAQQAGFDRSVSYLRRVDLWSGVTSFSGVQISASVPAHGVVMLAVYAAPRPPLVRHQGESYF
jgi:alpha-galactosidase